MAEQPQPLPELSNLDWVPYDAIHKAIEQFQETGEPVKAILGRAIAESMFAVEDVAQPEASTSLAE